MASGDNQFDTRVDLSGLMSVLSQHLYSTPDVAVRELVQNAHDSIVRRRLLTEGTGQSVEPGLIDVRADPDQLQMLVVDNGSGLTRQEIHDVLATIGVGATGDLRRRTGNDELIGLFGLGFLSAFVVASEVTVTTTSISTPNETWQYRSSTAFDYQVREVQQAPVGTTVTLQIAPGFEDLAHPEMVQSILDRYCRLLTVPVSLNGGPSINLTAPWRSPTSTNAERLHFAAEFDRRFEPLAVVPLTDEHHDLTGQFWVHGGSTYGNADNRHVSVYVRGMLLAENEQDLLPRWAGFISGVVESAGLTPTASRETLQRDSAYTEAQVVIAEALTVGLSNVALTNPARWQRIVERHSQALLGASVTDDRLFELTADQVVIPSSQGDRTMVAMQHGRRCYVSVGADRGFEELLFVAKGVPVIRGDLYGVLPFVAKYCARYGLELVTLGTDDGNAVLFEEVELSLDAFDWLNTELAGADEVVVAARFEPTEVPLVVVPDREAELKRRIERDDFNAAAGDGAAALARSFTSGLDDRAGVRVYVNVACPTVERLLALRSANPSGAMRAALLLRTLKTLMMAGDRRSGGRVNLTDAFTDALVVIDSMLLDGTGDEPNPEHTP